MIDAQITFAILAFVLGLAVAGLALICWHYQRKIRSLEESLNEQLAKLNSSYYPVNQDDERFRKLADASFEGIAVHDSDKLTDVNASLLKMLGYSSDEMIGKSPLTFIAESSRVAVKKHILRDEYNRIEVQALCRDGTLLDVEICSRPFSFNGRAMRVSAVRDITERKKADVILRNANENLEREVTLRTTNLRKTNDKLMAEIQERKQIERELMAAKYAAETANTAKSQFLANMSHELRTPLNAVIGFSEVIKNEMLGPISSQKYIEYARDIYQSGLHLLSLINDILDLSKIEAGQANLHFEPVAFSEVMETAHRLLKEKAEHKRLSIHQQFDDNAPALFADKRCLKQIFINLISNAIKFTYDSGNVWITVTINEARDIVLTVKDDGIGISEKDLKIVMEPFTQAENVFARKYQGTGLGLPLVKSLVELHDGMIAIESKINEGTIVTVIFPSARLRFLDDRDSLSSSAA
jgi:PAS domain S-box-containing protein